ncbi:unnamed protein product [Heligmosomoides polygyrus]|uniref:G_PROTEIN_RECEP_F1_2 domain-containing protein n=1 Tax=Heligmosomoides polygyrus TaxID=6339 RepID=A0A183GD83_HELPZ|nr:unnamed protein product [Heligmosomoides polygyrus]
MDIRELFSQKITTLRTLRETCQILALFFAVIVLLFLQVYDLIQIYSKEKEDIDRMIAQNHSWDLAQEYLAIILAFTPILIPLLASFYAYVFTKKVRLNIHDIHVYSYHRCELLIN